MKKFRVGDKVRITSPAWDGRTGTITAEHYDDNDFDYTVRVNGRNGSEYGFDEDELELAESASTTPPQGFAVGDRVRVRGWRECRCISGYVYEGDVGTVVKTGDGSFACFVRFDGSVQPMFDEEEGVGWGVYYDEVEVLSPATPKQAVAPSTTSTTIPPHLVELAKLGDDRPAPNGDEFVKSMLTFFTTEDADAMLAWAKANRRNVDMAIDVGCFALNVKWIRQSDAA
jgi:hypothetical protein